MGVKKKKAGSTARKVGKAAKKALGMGGKGGGKRRRGPSYWANKVLVEKLKKRYNRLKYGGMR